MNKSFNSVHVHSPLTLFPRIFIFLSLLAIPLLIILFPLSPPISSSITQKFHPNLNPKPAPISSPDVCESGRVYVYDLPAIFNTDLVGNCDDLDPWHWQCGVGTNGGYGLTTTELGGIVPESLAPAWHRTNQFSLEVIYHKRILDYKCRTLEPESATSFYIPFYAGLAVGKYLFTGTEKERDSLCETLLTWLQDQVYWRRSNGSDHFMALGRITWDFRRLTDPEKKWGSSFLNMPEIQNVTRLTIERAPYDYYDVGVPYSTGFHPRSNSDVRQWQAFVRSRNRTSRFSFVGAARDDIKNDIRGLLLRTCRNESDSCRVVDCAVTRCANGSSAIMESLLDSDFCLQPKGDSYTRRSVFDCMVAGSIPVFFWERTAYDQYEWYLPEEPGSYSVLIDHDKLWKEGGGVIMRVLGSYSRDEVRRMREKVIDLIPKIVYANYSEEGDAFGIAVEGVLKRIKVQKEMQSVQVMHAGRNGTRL